MLSDQQKNIIKQELMEMKTQYAKTEKETDIRNSERDAVGELSSYDNHPGDLGTELFERQKDMALNVHAGDEFNKAENALQALSDGTYGYCELCNREIPFERLEALPYTTYCIEHSPDQDIPNDRPSEKDILIMANPNSFADRDRREGLHRDGEDSFQEIAKSGTSETPSDFTGDRDNYNTLYYDEISDGSAEELEDFVSTDITGEARGYVRSELSEEYEERLDDEGIESPIGDIPYHLKDSYTEDK
ncbi:TraR/DksA C4-type zinc finger protein [Sporosarcina thermotolerans]|uniref:TraR/DksA C4-type zinc finger protein n=1 Tax=Sporosarcina thermotolerans TaxID=633404 RepID=A0AAW9AA44_9BACL|nr:TraR/DksA C4-type zinc finger protein [Sporosarcina thermotolerans]MDW0116051.1 TraR/DksA C4-type zinc finger protein [Sporosarcina thermotolerans]WHT49769.1 TraR/DksA C4-type zinc finger protein [Sporosarcina thermotolerans]